MAGSGEFLTGITDVWRGLTFLIERPRLWPWAVAPFLISLLLFAAILWFVTGFIGGWITGFLPDEGVAWRILEIALIVIIWIAFLLVSVFTFIPIVMVVAAPFNDLLSEKTERLYAGENLDQPFSIGYLFRSLRVTTVATLQRALKLMLLLLFALFLNLIPLIGSLVATVLATHFTIRFLSLEFTSYSMDRRLWTWPQQRAYMDAHRARTMGFGSMAFVVMLVPLVNAAFIPVSAVAGTLLFCDTGLTPAGAGDKVDANRVGGVVR
jgi:CysZ protein